MTGVVVGDVAKVGIAKYCSLARRGGAGLVEVKWPGCCSSKCNQLLRPHSQVIFKLVLSEELSRVDNFGRTVSNNDLGTEWRSSVWCWSILYHTLNNKGTSDRRRICTMRSLQLKRKCASHLHWNPIKGIRRLGNDLRCSVFTYFTY